MSAALLVAVPVLMGLLAVGAVILIKTERRRQGTRDPRHTDVVPVNPLSERDAARMRQRYLIAAAVVCGALIVLALVLR